MIGRVLPAVLIAAVFGFSTARAETYLPTPLTAEQVFAKAAAARGNLQRGSYHRTYEETRGGTTTSMDLYESGDDYVETDRQGAYTWGEGSFGNTEWRQDENGVVTLVSGFAQTANPFVATLATRLATAALLRCKDVSASTGRHVRLSAATLDVRLHRLSNAVRRDVSADDYVP